MIIQRTVTSHLLSLASQFSVVAVVGPRQSGKTTLAKTSFPDYAYVTMEDLDMRITAQSDPRGFLASYSTKKGVIIDEIQEVPELLSYMQGIVDQAYKPGFFIITGSQNFLMHEKISQTLAGRIAMLTLLPLSTQELENAQLLPESVEALLIKGGYPQLYIQKIPINIWCANYISTYVEKDVRQILQISDVIAFQRFLKLCAARIGNVINYASLARDADISPKTAKAWLSILESSYIIKMLYPYYKNFNKRVIKSPKLYFCDTALVCSLLGIKSADELYLHPLRGPLFESFTISEIFKYGYNNNKNPQIYYWRDVQGHEIDVIVEKSFTDIVPVEIKAGKTIQNDFFKGLTDWEAITDQAGTKSYVVYGGENNVLRSQGSVFSWTTIPQMLDLIYE